MEDVSSEEERIREWNKEVDREGIGVDREVCVMEVARGLQRKELAWNPSSFTSSVADAHRCVSCPVLFGDIR